MTAKEKRFHEFEASRVNRCSVVLKSHTEAPSDVENFERLIFRAEKLSVDRGSLEFMATVEKLRQMESDGAWVFLATDTSLRERYDNVV